MGLPGAEGVVGVGPSQRRLIKPEITQRITRSLTAMPAKCLCLYLSPVCVCVLDPPTHCHPPPHHPFGSRRHTNKKLSPESRTRKSCVAIIFYFYNFSSLLMPTRGWLLFLCLPASIFLTRFRSLHGKKYTTGRDKSHR